MAARAGEPERAQEPRHFLKAFISRNGFHSERRPEAARLLAAFTYRPFTLEGNFAAGQAVHEMLLQSWGGRVRIFPAVPKAWADVRFPTSGPKGLCRFRRREADDDVGPRRAERGGTLRLRDPFGGAAASWNRDDVRRVGETVARRRSRR